MNLLSTPQKVEKTVTDILLECQELMGDFPKDINLKISIKETDLSYRVDFIYLNGDYWFTWLKAEKHEKFIAYVYDSYNYIMTHK